MSADHTAGADPKTSSDRGAPAPLSVQRSIGQILGLGLLAFVLLALRFSPNWVEFYRGVREAYAPGQSVAERAAVEKAILSGYSERGWHVLRQARDLHAAIADPNHKIMRWRLLIPVVGHLLHFPGWLTLGLAQIGCGIWLVWLMAIWFARIGSLGGRWLELVSLVVIAGASAPFFAAMGWLGYYDSWLVLAFLAVTHSSRRWVVWLACVLAPWVDERFVIGLPLALLVRWLLAERPAIELRRWLMQEALVPVLLAVGYALMRLKLGGEGGSQTIGEYVRQFVLAPQIPVSQRLYGAWSGLRFGWILVLVGIVEIWRGSSDRRCARTLSLGLAIAFTCAIGLLTALDMGRSMVLLLPAVSFGALQTFHLGWWRAWRVSAILAIIALIVPAQHVVGVDARRVDNAWMPSLPLQQAQNNIGMMFLDGQGVPASAAAAQPWFRRSLENGSADSANNLALILAKMPGREEEARALYEMALRANANNAATLMNYATLLAELPRQEAGARLHYEAALRIAPNSALAHMNFAVLLARLPGQQEEAIAHYQTAIRLRPDLAEAHANLGNLLATIPPRSQEAMAHYEEALRLKPDAAVTRSNLAVLISANPERRLEAIRQYEAALKFSPDLTDAHKNLAILLSSDPRLAAQAVAHYEFALRLNPQDGQVHNNLANLLMTLPGREAEALAHYELAVRLLPDDPASHFNLARQLEGINGMRNEAVAHYRRAVELDPNLGAAQAALERLLRP